MPATKKSPSNEEVRPKREPNPPRFTVGDSVRTKYTIRVKCSGIRNRRWLYLLPGTQWTVTNVSEPEMRVRNRRMYTYKLKSSGIVIERKEHRLMCEAIPSQRSKRG